MPCEFPDLVLPALALNLPQPKPPSIPSIGIELPDRPSITQPDLPGLPSISGEFPTLVRPSLALNLPQPKLPSIPSIGIELPDQPPCPLD